MAPNEVWGCAFLRRILSRYIGYLRARPKQRAVQVIHTVRGVGYVLRENAP